MLKVTDENNARALINNLPDDIRSNCRVYTPDGKVVVSPIKAADSPQFRIENGSLVPVSDKIDIFNTIKQKLKINHQDLPLADQKN